MRKPDVDLAALRALVARVYGRRQVDICRADSGTTTQIYRLQTTAAVHYLRVAEDQPDRFGAELLVHERLLGLGVRVPAIVHYEPFDAVLNRSILITTEIPGRPVSSLSDSAILPAVLRAAGRDLALLNSIPVDGFGFVTRSEPHPTYLSAEFATVLEFIERDLESDLATLEVDQLPSVRAGVRQMVESRKSQLVGLTGGLAHGDFDGSHIYVATAHYSGIIDLGEIRGADPLYDLGHFAVIAGESLPAEALDHLLAGYGEVTPLTEDDRRRMWLWAALIGVRFLARTRGRIAASLSEHITGRLDRAFHEQAR